jgi:pimeloyl-ACP methyl ester carboxylesterase
MAQVPTYYVMERGKGMAENIAAYAIPPDYDCAWLTDAELGVYVSEYRRTGFNGALHSYRARRSNQPEAIAEITTFANRTIDVPAMFVGGQKDWGTYQTPGAYEAMQTRACSRMVGAHLIAGAGHWVQQEKPGEVVQQFLEFLTHHARPSGR